MFTVKQWFVYSCIADQAASQCRAYFLTIKDSDIEEFLYELFICKPTSTTIESWSNFWSGLYTSWKFLCLIRVFHVIVITLLHSNGMPCVIVKTKLCYHLRLASTVTTVNTE